MRIAAAALLLAAAGCAEPPLELPVEPAARAVHCSAATALDLREGQAADAPMSFDDFTRILHVAMIAAARGGERVDMRRLMTISQTAPVQMEELADHNWRSLLGPCDEAFPEARRPAGPLPETPFEAAMMCFGLADFLARTAADHPPERQAAAALADRALAAATPVLRQRVQSDEDATRISDRYMAQAFLAGTPPSLLDQCARRFGARAG